MQEWFNPPKLVDVIHLIRKLKDKNHMIMSLDEGKAIGKQAIICITIEVR